MPFFIKSGLMPVFRPSGPLHHLYALRTCTTIEFPKIRKKWPPGLQGVSTPKLAWELDAERQKLMQIPSAKARLEYLSGTRTREEQRHMQFHPEDSVYMMGTDPYRHIPPNLEHFRYTTKTKLVSESLPSAYDGLDVAHMIKPLKDIMLHSLNNIYKPNLSDDELRHAVIGEVMKAAMSCLSLDNEHLLRAQVDENCRWEAFWKRGGYDMTGTDMDPAIRGSGELNSVLRFQLLHTCDWQIRTEMPIPEFVPEDHALVQSERYDYIYEPLTMGQTVYDRRPTNVSGVFINDPCEFTSLSFHCLGSKFQRYKEIFHGDDVVLGHKIRVGLLTGFASCVVQAHMQGFNWLLDVTYPFSTQSVVFDGRNVFLCAYQLNTLEMWQNEQSETKKQNIAWVSEEQSETKKQNIAWVSEEQSETKKQNIAWVSEDMPLLEYNADGRVTDINDTALALLLKAMLLEPTDRGCDLRPYLPDDPSPRFKTKYFNHVGEEQFKPRPIDRHEYPENSTYYYSHIP